MAEISSTGDLMLSVLEAVAHRGPISALECAKECRINRTVAHRLLSTLAQRLYVIKGPDGYIVGPSVLALGDASKTSLVGVAKPEMAKLAARVGETVVLQAIVGKEAVVVDQAVDTSHIVVVRHNPGSRHPLHQGASGLAIMAHLSPQTIESLLSGISESEALAIRQKLTTIRSKGFAHTKDELQLGVHGLAAPILTYGECPASIAILVPKSRADQLADQVGALRETAGAIGRLLSSSDVAN